MNEIDERDDMTMNEYLDSIKSEEQDCIEGGCTAESNVTDLREIIREQLQLLIYWNKKHIGFDVGNNAEQIRLNVETIVKTIEKGLLG